MSVQVVMPRPPKGQVGEVRDQREVDRPRGPELPLEEPRETGGELGADEFCAGLGRRSLASRRPPGARSTQGVAVTRPPWRAQRQRKPSSGGSATNRSLRLQCERTMESGNRSTSQRQTVRASGRDMSTLRCRLSSPVMLVEAILRGEWIRSAEEQHSIEQVSSGMFDEMVPEAGRSEGGSGIGRAGSESVRDAPSDEAMRNESALAARARGKAGTASR